MIGCFFLLSYRTSKNISYVSDTIDAGSWKFINGGYLEINISDTNNSEFTFKICTRKEYEDIYYSLYSGSKTCEIHETVQMDESGMISYSHNFTKAGKYITLITVNDAYSSYYLSLHYRNGDSLLSADLIPCLYFEPFIFVAVLVPIAYWIYNWYKNFSSSNVLHYYFSFSLLIILFCTTVNMAYYYFANKNDDTYSVEIVIIVADVLFYSVFLTSVLLLSRGYGILHTDYNIVFMLCTLLSSILFFSFVEVSRCTDKISDLVFLVVSTVMLLLFYSILYSSIRSSTYKITAHIYVIVQAGIDPSTTPVARKITTLNSVFVGTTVFIVTKSLKIIVSDMDIFDEWVCILFDEVVNSLVVYVIVYFFKLNKMMGRGYQNIGESSAPREFTIEEVMGLVIPETYEGLQPWDQSSELPAQPLIVSQKSTNDLAEMETIDVKSNSEAVRVNLT